MNSTLLKAQENPAVGRGIEGEMLSLREMTGPPGKLARSAQHAKGPPVVKDIGPG